MAWGKHAQNMATGVDKVSLFNQSLGITRYPAPAPLSFVLSHTFLSA